MKTGESPRGSLGRSFLVVTRAATGAIVTDPEYEIHIVGVLPESVLREIEGATAVTEPGHTVLRGAMPDQAAVHGIIARIQGLGLELVEFRRVGHAPAERDAGRSPSEIADDAPVGERFDG